MELKNKLYVIVNSIVIEITQIIKMNLSLLKYTKVIICFLVQTGVWLI